MIAVRLAARSIALAAFLAGCTVFTPTPDRSRFFVLTPIAPAAETAKTPFRPTVGIGPFTFPPYLDRPEMITRVSANEVRRATFDYWAGSLAQQFQATLAQDLQADLGGAPIRTYSWYAANAPDLAVEADVRSFEAGADGRARLAARWRIRKGPDARIAGGGDFDRTRALRGGAPEQAAAALSDLLGELAGEIATALKTAAAATR